MPRARAEKEKIMNPLYILATPLGYIMEFIIGFISNYGLALIVFTFIIKLAMVPLSIKQQKGTARMGAFSEPMNEIREKYKDDRQKQNEELMKFQQEHGFSMTAGCLPMVINLFIIFGLFQVVYYPLQYIFHISSETITAAATFAGIQDQAVNVLESNLLGIATENAAAYEQFFTNSIAAIDSLDFHFLGINLLEVPSVSNVATWILPGLTMATMIGLQIATQKMMGTANTQQMGTMKYMPWIMALMFIPFLFTAPLAFSLYYFVSNTLAFIQTILLKKLYDPEKMKAQIKADIEAKRKEKKQRKEVVITDETGNEVVKKVSESELIKLRLAKARELDEEKYKNM